jgi:hypothetical protein
LPNDCDPAVVYMISLLCNVIVQFWTLAPDPEAACPAH